MAAAGNVKHAEYNVIPAHYWIEYRAQTKPV